MKTVSSLPPRVIEEYPVKDCVLSLLESDSSKPYHALPPLVAQRLDAVNRRYGRHRAGLYFGLVVKELVQSAPARAADLPLAVQEIFSRELERIASAVDELAETLEYDTDVWIKDLQTLTLRLVPCGAQVLDLYGGCIPRSSIFLGGAEQFLGVLTTSIRCGGFDRFAEIHTHTPTLGEFNEQGWDECYLRVAALLQQRHDVRGMVGSSWFYDPALSDISPRLSYLRMRPVSNGAKVFRIGSNPGSVANATETSATRRTLYERGDYVPTEYLLVWPRKALIDWARKKTI